MEQAYYNPSHPDSFGSAAGVLRQTKSNFNDVKQFLSNQDAYTLHADVRRRFPRRKTLAFGKDDLWQADLIDLSSLSSTNDGFRYLLTAIDILSKKARAVPLKNKTADAVVAGFREFFKQEKPKHLQTDKGTEFLNTKLQKFLIDENVKHYTSQNEDTKCAVVDRWHRTILAKVYRKTPLVIWASYKI